ncbi:MAG TPA: aminotransferase class IV [Acidimicrobiales bacterium]|nr:aminotransferase class IV [Acidimicrobiales bacterium]
MPLIYVNGALVTEEHATISVFDHGLIVGDGVFETILLNKGRPFALSRHLARLEHSTRGLGINPIPAEDVARAITAVVNTAEFAIGRIRVTITSGAGPLGSGRGTDPPTLVVAADPFESFDEPSAVMVVPWPRNEHSALFGLKTTSYAENALALERAHGEGADEAIFGNTAGMLCEGTGSNVFVVIDGELVTPPTSAGLLEGVTRALVLERHGGAERDVPLAQFAPNEVEEAFLTSTLRGVQPIAAIDGKKLATAGGPETRKAAAVYASLLSDEIDP